MSNTETFGDKLKECKKVKFLIEDAKSDFEISPETIKVIDIYDIMRYVVSKNVNTPANEDTVMAIRAEVKRIKEKFIKDGLLVKSFVLADSVIGKLIDMVLQSKGYETEPYKMSANEELEYHKRFSEIRRKVYDEAKQEISFIE